MKHTINFKNKYNTKNRIKIKEGFGKRKRRRGGLFGVRWKRIPVIRDVAKVVTRITDYVISPVLDSMGANTCDNACQARKKYDEANEKLKKKMKDVENKLNNKSNDGRLRDFTKKIEFFEIYFKNKFSENNYIVENAEFNTNKENFYQSDSNFEIEKNFLDYKTATGGVNLIDINSNENFKDIRDTYNKFKRYKNNEENVEKVKGEGKNYWMSDGPKKLVNTFISKYEKLAARFDTNIFKKYDKFKKVLDELLKKLEKVKQERIAFQSEVTNFNNEKLTDSLVETPTLKEINDMFDKFFLLFPSLKKMTPTDKEIRKGKTSGKGKLCTIVDFKNENDIWIIIDGILYKNNKKKSFFEILNKNSCSNILNGNDYCQGARVKFNIDGTEKIVRIDNINDDNSIDISYDGKSVKNYRFSGTDYDVAFRQEVGKDGYNNFEIEGNCSLDNFNNAECSGHKAKIQWTDESIFKDLDKEFNRDRRKRKRRKKRRKEKFDNTNIIEGFSKKCSQKCTSGPAGRNCREKCKNKTRKKERAKDAGMSLREYRNVRGASRDSQGGLEYLSDEMKKLYLTKEYKLVLVDLENKIKSVNRITNYFKDMVRPGLLEDVLDVREPKELIEKTREINDHINKNVLPEFMRLTEKSIINLSKSTNLLYNLVDDQYIDVINNIMPLKAENEQLKMTIFNSIKNLKRVIKKSGKHFKNKEANQMISNLGSTLSILKDSGVLRDDIIYINENVIKKISYKKRHRIVNRYPEDEYPEEYPGEEYSNYFLKEIVDNKKEVTYGSDVAFKSYSEIQNMFNNTDFNDVIKTQKSIYDVYKVLNTIYQKDTPKKKMQVGLLSRLSDTIESNNNELKCVVPKCGYLNERQNDIKKVLSDAKKIEKNVKIKGNKYDEQIKKLKKILFNKEYYLAITIIFILFLILLIFIIRRKIAFIDTESFLLKA
jgi:hypothetical protein